MAEDFLTIAQRGVEAYFLANPRIKSILKGGGIVEGYTAARGLKEPDVLSEHDLPLIRVKPSSMPGNLTFASNMTQADLTLTIEIITGDKRITHQLTPLLAAVFACLAAAIHDPGIIDLTWETYPFVKSMSLDRGTIGFADISQSSAIQGWVAICDLTLHMHLPTSMLAEWANLE